jgi:hypothetical protein
MSAFHDYVRGMTDTVPDGYAEPGMRLYRHLVYLGASQMLEAAYPALRNTLDEPDWRELIEAFVRSSRWQSHYYGDLTDEFLAFLEEQAG